MKSLVIVMLPLLICVAEWGCTPSNGPIPTEQTILPLAVGNEWIGQVKEYDAKAKLDSTWFDTLQIWKSKVVGGETWYYSNIFALYAYPPEQYFGWFTNRPDGLYTCDSDAFDKAYCYAKYPSSSGDTCVKFDYRFDTSGNGLSDGIRVDTTNFNVNVPAGNFKSYVFRGYYYNRDWDQIVGTYEPARYYAPGIGLVQSGYFQSDGQHDSLSTKDHTWQLVRAILR